jgi:hypothetical protein
VPRTVGEDGQHLDAMVVVDEPTVPGCLIETRLNAADAHRILEDAVALWKRQDQSVGLRGVVWSVGRRGTGAHRPTKQQLWLQGREAVVSSSAAGRSRGLGRDARRRRGRGAGDYVRDDAQSQPQAV